MPTAITLASPASFVSPLLPPLPTIPNLHIWSYTAGSLANSVNAGTAGVFSNAPNAPTFQPTYMNGKGINGALATPSFTPGPNITFMIVTRWIGGGSGAGAQSLATLGTGFGIINAGTSFNIQANGISSPTGLAVTNYANWKFFAVNSQAAGATTIYNETDNTSQVANANGTIVFGAAQHGIGGTANSAGTNSQAADIAWIMYASTFLSKSTIDQVYAHVKSVLTPKGFPI